MSAPYNLYGDPQYYQTYITQDQNQANALQNQNQPQPQPQPQPQIGPTVVNQIHSNPQVNTIHDDPNRRLNPLPIIGGFAEAPHQLHDSNPGRFFYPGAEHLHPPPPPPPLADPNQPQFYAPPIPIVPHFQSAIPMQQRFPPQLELAQYGSYIQGINGFNTGLPPHPNFIGGINTAAPAFEQSKPISNVAGIPPVLDSSSSNSTPVDNKKSLNKRKIYKPKKPKENSKPRINKLNTSDFFKNFSTKPVSRSYDRESEASIDPLFVHFQNSLKIPKNKINSSIPPFFQVKNELERKLFDLFVHQVSRCMDMFMVKDFFTDIVPQMALMDDTGMVLSSMFTFSALMLQRVDPSLIDESIPMNYYHETIRSIRHHISTSSSSTDEDGIIARCLLSTILLCVYEMFFLATDNTYVKGAASLLTSIINKSQESSPLTTSPFLQMCFWAMFVCDLILSLKFNLPTMFSVTNFWKQIDPLYIDSFENKKLSNDVLNDLFLSRAETIWWLQRALLDFSIINEFNNIQTVPKKEDSESNKSFRDWKILNNRVTKYGLAMPLALKPVIYKPSDDDSTYPVIYYRDELSALINLQFKLSQVALYQSLIQRTDVHSTETQEILNSLPSNHIKLLAKDIIGILKSYDLNLYLWPINIHTIRCVARYLHDDEKEYQELEALVERVIETCHFIFQSKLIIG